MNIQIFGTKKSMELFDICDENGQPTGETVERSIAHRDGIPHRTAHVWLTRNENGRNQILLQKRHRNKDSFPGMYDTSSAGHIPAGDEPLVSALRELKEELGIDAGPDMLDYAGSFHASYALPFHGSIFKDDEYVSVYVYTAPVDISDIRIQEEEIESVEWFDLDEVYSECRNGIRTRFCVPMEGLDILSSYLKKRNSKGPLEIERKFLIRYPDLDMLEQLCSKKADMSQTYLDSEKGLSRRIRKTVINGTAAYWYTEKIKLSDMTRIERERKTTEEEYLELMKEAIPTAQTINKTRYFLPEGNLCFEIDIFPEWTDRAFAEVELESEDQEFCIPEYITIIKEVTDDKRYTNASLSKNGFVYDEV